MKKPVIIGVVSGISTFLFLIIAIITTFIICGLTSASKVDVVSTDVMNIITYNGRNYYEFDSYADMLEKIQSPLPRIGDYPTAYSFPEEELVSLSAVIDFSKLPVLEEREKYTIDDCYYISKYDSAENPIMIIKEDTDWDVTYYYLREGFTQNDLPNVDSATIQEIYLEENSVKLRTLNEQEQEGVVAAIRANSVEKMTDTLSFYKVEWSIYLCIRYTDSPFVQVVGQYSPDFSFRK